MLLYHQTVRHPDTIRGGDCVCYGLCKQGMNFAYLLIWIFPILAFGLSVKRPNLHAFNSATGK